MDIMTRISKAKTALTLDHPFLGAISLNMPVEITTDIPTAATNGKRLKFNPNFVAPLSDAQLLFLVAHECMHPILEHNFRCGERDPMKWNAAGDFVINQLLADEGIGKFIPGGCLDKAIYDAGGGTSEGVYAILPEIPSIGGTGPDLEPGATDPAEVAQQAAEMKVLVAQAAQAAKMAGKLSANMERFIGDVLKPKVDWRDVLQRFIHKTRTDQRTFARPNRRFVHHGLYLPTVSGEALGEIVFAVDMSGSISPDEANQFSAECRKVFEDCRPRKLHLMFFDSKVCGHDVLTQDDDYVFNPRGGGGTAFSPVFERIEAEAIEPVAVVFLTDLYCSDFGTPPSCPVLWVSNGADHAPFGEVVMMKP